MTNTKGTGIERGWTCAMCGTRYLDSQIFEGHTYRYVEWRGCCYDVEFYAPSGLKLDQIPYGEMLSKWPKEFQGEVIETLNKRPALSRSGGITADGIANALVDSGEFYRNGNGDVYHGSTRGPVRVGNLVESFAALIGEQETGRETIGEVTQYCLHSEPMRPDVSLQAARQIDGSTLWKIIHGNVVLNKSGEWEFEPMPSSRDEAYLNRTRWADPHEAKAAWIAATHPNTENNKD